MRKLHTGPRPQTPPWRTSPHPDTLFPPVRPLHLVQTRITRRRQLGSARHASVSSARLQMLLEKKARVGICPAARRLYPPLPNHIPLLLCSLRIISMPVPPDAPFRRAEKPNALGHRPRETPPCRMINANSTLRILAAAAADAALQPAILLPPKHSAATSPRSSS